MRQHHIRARLVWRNGPRNAVRPDCRPPHVCPHAPEVPPSIAAEVLRAWPPNWPAVHDVSRAYFRQIDALNQRGGRTLSIADLICAGTITPNAAAYVGAAIAGGASLLTAASPGGAGKTALLAALLGFLPEDRPIVTVEHSQVLDGAAAEADPKCYLAHEIGDGRWYGYIWGPAVARYLALPADGHSVASCLHADTLDELRGVLRSPPLRVGEATLLGIDFILFMHIDTDGRGDAWGYRRRVAAVYEADRAAGEHRLIFTWDREADALVQLTETPCDIRVRRLAEALGELGSSGVRDFSEVRRALLALGGDKGRDH